MTKTPFAPRKAVAALLSSILCVCAPLQSFAQAINARAGVAPVTGPAVIPQLGGGFAPISAPSLSGAGLIAPSLSGLSMTPAPALAAPVALVAPTASVSPAAAIAAKPATPLAAAVALGASLNGDKKDAAAAAPALDSFYSGSAAAKSDDAVPGAAGEGAAPLAPAAKAGPVGPETNPELFAPRSSRVGVGPAKYVYWNAFYNILQWANLKFAKDPNRRVSWDKWPTKLGLAYLIAKIRFVRSDTLTDPNDYASNDVKPKGEEPLQAKRGYTADGSWVSDKENPRMGAENTRDGSNIPPKKVRPDAENLMLKAREIGKLKHRLEIGGKTIFQPALILNDLAGGWIQFQFHNFGGNTKRDPITENPHKVEMPAKEGWKEKEMVVDRTSKDPTRVTDNGRPTIMNERTQAWIQAQIYGTNEEEQKPLRTWTDGKMLVDENGRLPANPAKPGIDLSGFTNNYNPLLSFLHWAFVVNHNNIVDHIRKFNPGWDDAALFDYARKINVASINQIHTTEWTEDLLQHPTLQEGMHAEFYGLFGPKIKAWLMRMSYRHPWFAKLIKPVSNNDVIWGMPGSKWEHHDGPFQVPKHFRMVYRLHELILDQHEFIEPGTDRMLGRAELIDFVHQNTRPIVEKYGYDVLAYSFVKKSAGALKLHNFPTALTQFKNQQNGQLTDLAMLDIFREMTDGTGSYNEFRRSLGEPPVKSFLELTGGDAELAKELERTFEGDIEAVPPGIGILAEPKPAGFALGFTQFYQFVLNAPRRVKSNRHLTEFYTHKDYTYEGMEWAWHSGGMGGVIARAMKGLPNGPAVIASMEGVTRWFAPWQDTETFPVRLLDKANENSSKILKKTMRLLAIGTFTAFSAWLGVAVSAFTVVPVAMLALGLPVLLYYKRMLAWRYMQKTWQSAYTDRRHSMFPTLFQGEKTARVAAVLGRLGARVALYGGLFAAWTLIGTNPVVAVLAGLTALSARSVMKATDVYENDMQILKIALQNRLREGYEAQITKAADVPGDSAIEKRYSFLVQPGSNVATVWRSYRALNEHGLGKISAFKTALISHIVFGHRTQRGLGLKARWNAGILFNPLAIYVPNMVKAQGPSTTRIYAAEGNEKGIKPGDVDMEEFDKMFSTYAPGRDYMTAYDFSRLREGNRWRAKQEGIGGPFYRFLGGLAVKKRTDQLLQLYADRVANEDKALVPAISRDMLLRFYQGSAQADIMAERALDGVHPDLRAANPGGKPTLKEKAKSDLKKLGGAVRTLAGSLVLPYTPARVMTDVRAAGTFFSTVWRLGWIAIAAVVSYYLVRDVTLYILIPWLVAKGLFGF
ncbi:MAG: hypothetical protein HY923_11265 [Elusimicrobia bacterium]|nr:hypothetical protein [Elusimicrobiota bacterium]